MGVQNLFDICKDVIITFGYLISLVLAGNDEIHGQKLVLLFVKVKTLSSKTFCFVTNNLTAFGKRQQCFQSIDLYRWLEQSDGQAFHLPRLHSTLSYIFRGKDYLFSIVDSKYVSTTHMLGPSFPKSQIKLNILHSPILRVPHGRSSDPEFATVLRFSISSENQVR